MFYDRACRLTAGLLVLALVIASSAQAQIRITEWMYDGPGDEFIELTNVGDQPVDMTGWTYDDDSADPDEGFDLSGFGIVQPGESVVLVEADPEAFRADWGMCAEEKIIGPYSNNLGRNDQINIFDADGVLVDVLTYGDQDFPGSIRTQGASGWVSAAGLGVDDVYEWTLSSADDGESSHLSSGGAIGSPGMSTRATVAYNPCDPDGEPEPVVLLAQDWTDTGLITVNNNWDGVSGIVGYRGDGMTGGTGVDPQTVLAEAGAGGPVVNVMANQTNPNTQTTGGVAEFHIADPVVALQGSGTARAPHLVLTVDATGYTDIEISYNLRDIDGSADNSVQPVALQYRVGASGNYTNVPEGFVADASTGPNEATLVTPVSVTLPAAASNQPVVQVRIITTDAVGSDEWIGVDDILVIGVPSSGELPITVDAGGPYTIAPDGSVTLNATVSNPDGGELDILWTVEPEGPVFADATVINTELFGNGSGQGSHTLTLTVDDGSGPVSDTANLTIMGITLISQVQGPGDVSPLVGQTVTVSAVVTSNLTGDGLGNQLGGFYIEEEEEDRDGDPLTSEGVFVFAGAQSSALTHLQVGDVVTVTGVVEERFGQTQINASAGSIIETGTTATLPPPAIIGELPEADPVAFAELFEPLEGMRVQLAGTWTVTENYDLHRFGEVQLVPGTQPLQSATNIGLPGPEAGAFEAATQSTERTTSLTLDDARDGQLSPSAFPVPYVDPPVIGTLRRGSTIDDLVAVMSFDFGRYRLRPIDHESSISFTQASRPIVPDVGGDLVVATFNVLNYFNGDGAGGGFPTSRGARNLAEFERQTDKIVAALIAMDADAIGLIEIENDGHTPIPAIQSLTDALNDELGEPRYAWVNTGGQVGDDEITQAWLYDTTTLTVDGVTFLDDIYPFNFNTRPALAARFTEIASDQDFVAIVNHFKSKGSVTPGNQDPAGNQDQGDGQAASNSDRVRAAEELLVWINSDSFFDADDRILVLGDINAYAKEDPVVIFADNGYADLLAGQTPESYTYTFFGAEGRLDYALANPAAQAAVTSAAVWYINADEPRGKDYTDFNQPALYEPGPYRSSDHDPVIVGLDLTGEDLSGFIVITEWMYNTIDDGVGEFIELTNIGLEPVSMIGWSYDDDSDIPGVFSLSPLGTVQPGESVVLTEIDPNDFRAQWGLCPQTNVIGPYTNNLGRNDQINIYNPDGERVDRLTYGDQNFPGSIRTNGVSGWVQTAGIGEDDVYLWTRSTLGDQEGSWFSSTGNLGSPGISTHGGYDPCDHDPGDGPTITVDEPFMIGAVGDPTNPGVVLTAASDDFDVAELSVTVTSTNAAVLATGDITITGDGAQRVVSFEPAGRGVTELVFTVTDPDEATGTVEMQYYASLQAPDETGRYHHRISDASSALDVGDGYVLLADDETNVLFLHHQETSGNPVKTWEFTSVQLGTTSEIDFEGMARSGDLLIISGSHGNNRSGEARPERRTFIAATITGQGADTELTFLGRYNNLWAELRAWDQNDGHGLGANALGFIAGTAPGVEPNPPGGFNIEAIEFGPDGETVYLGFRAPTIDVDGTFHGLIVPLLNVEDISNGVPGTGPGQFGAPILLDLDGRSIRELRRNEHNEYLIAAGPSPHNPDWALYTWNGDAGTQPAFNRLLPPPDYLTGGVWESIVSVPHPLEEGAVVRLVTDSGDTNFYGTGMTKDLIIPLRKSYTQEFTLAAVPDGEPGEEVFRLTLLHNNDGESWMLPAPPRGGVARFGTLVGDLRAEAAAEPTTGGGSLLVSSGDNFLAGVQLQASLANFSDDGDYGNDGPFYDVVAMDYIGYDASAVGNHEFDFGPAVLGYFMSQFVDSQIRFVSANLDVTGDAALAAFADTPPGAPGTLVAWTQVQVDGRTVAIVGATTPNLAGISSPGPDVIVDPDLTTVVQDAIDAATFDGTDIVIMISHLQSIADDQALVATLSGLDIAVSGGGAELLANPGDLLLSDADPGLQETVHAPYPLLQEDADGIEVPIVTTSGLYGYLGRLIVDFDDNGNVIAIDGRSGPVRNVYTPDNPQADTVDPDPMLVLMVEEPVAAFIDDLDDQVIAHTEVVLDGQTASVRTHETNLGSLFADALRETVEGFAPEFGATRPTVALQNSGGIRNDLVLGPDEDVTLLDTFRIAAFTNFVGYTLDLSPEKLKELLEHSVALAPASAGQFGQISGIEFTYNPDLPAQQVVRHPDGTVEITSPGQRVRSVVLTLNDDDPANDIVVVWNGQIADGAPSVDLASNSFTITNGDNYPFNVGDDYTNTPFTYQQSLAAKFINLETVTAADYPEGGLGRIVATHQGHPAPIRITEWMYDGAGGEFIEFTNVGDEPVDLTNWTYDDDSADPSQGFDLSGFGLVQPGESVVLVEVEPETFRADWGLCSEVNIIGPYSNNLGRNDQINIFNADDVLVDVLTYGDQDFPGSIRTQNFSGWVSAVGLGVDDVYAWTLSSVGDQEASFTSSGGDVGSPGRSSHGAYDPCKGTVEHTLIVMLEGSGTVSGDGIACPEDCEQTYLDGTEVTLTAAFGSGFVFAGWEGDCTGTDDCSLIMDADKSVSAIFLAQAEIGVDPESLSATLISGQSETQTLTLSNLGTDTLVWQITEEECKLPEWIEFDPTSGSVAGGDIQEVEVVFNATGLAPDDYQTTLCIASNDPATPLVTVPASLTVKSSEPLPDEIFRDRFEGGAE